MAGPGAPPSIGGSSSGSSSGSSRHAPAPNFFGFPSGEPPPNAVVGRGVYSGEDIGSSARDPYGHDPSGRVVNTFDHRNPNIVVRYISGDEFAPGARGAEEIRNLQLALVRAHLLGDHFTHGRWDVASQKAFKTLLAFANVNGLTWQQALQTYQAQASRGALGNAPGNGSSTSAGQLIQVTNPEDLRLAFQDASRQLTTGQFNDATINEMIAAYQHAEVVAQTTGQQTLSGNVGGGAHSIAGTVTGPPSVATFAREQAMHHDPASYNARQFADTVEGQVLPNIGRAPGGVGPEKL